MDCKQKNLIPAVITEISKRFWTYFRIADCKQANSHPEVLHSGPYIHIFLDKIKLMLLQFT